MNYTEQNIVLKDKAMWTYSTQPQPVSAVLADAYRLYKKSFSKVWYWHLILFLPMSLFSIFSEFYAKVLPLYSLWIATAIVVMIYLFGECFLLYRIDGIARQGDSDTEQGWSWASKKIFPVIVLYFFTLIFLGITVFFIASLPIFNQTAITEASLVGKFIMALQFPITIGLSVLLAYYFWFMAFIIMMDIVIRNQPLLTALKQAFSLVAGNWWRSFVAIMLGSALLFVAAKIFGSIAFSITGSYVVEVIAILLAYVLFHSVFNSVLLVQFNDLQLRQAQPLPGLGSSLVE